MNILLTDWNEISRKCFLTYCWDMGTSGPRWPKMGSYFCWSAISDFFSPKNPAPKDFQFLKLVHWYRFPWDPYSEKYFPLVLFWGFKFYTTYTAVEVTSKVRLYGGQHGARGHYQWILDIRLIHCTVVLTMGSFSTLQMSSSRPLKYKAKYLKPCIWRQWINT